ncbi:MAG: bifunctional 4-hydroxy-2-oxoglutarate aldolase/2-dehydro-3-deoxy-phosphogluconate aldolase [Proteobacteria bacterium]|nr:bifunctional 4-hydroxy-2-oxoglutarate aldolase/2-dehydro-3-deoxy-phosphogluconate aldolase [Pseudomonadota bacterium]
MFYDTLKKIRLVPVVVIDDAELATPLAEAISAGGLSCVEITLRTDEALAAIKTMAARPDILVGAGTVLTLDQAKAAVDCGASFIVSPGMSPTLVDWCLARQVPVIPGCATATEIQMAMEQGLETVKFFPAEQLGGISMLQALAGVFRAMHFMPTGGITAGNLLHYLALPQVVACGGSWLVKTEWLRDKKFVNIRQEISKAVELLNNTLTR